MGTDEQIENQGNGDASSDDGHYDDDEPEAKSIDTTEQPGANLNESNATIQTDLETDDKDQQSGSDSDSGNRPDKNASTSLVPLVKNKTYPEHLNPFTSDCDENLFAQADLS